MPQGRGEAGEIILVIDSTRWAGDIGKELRLTFREIVDGLPREEPLFDLRQIVPTNFKGILKNAKNLVLVIPMSDSNPEGRKMQNLFTNKSLDSLLENQDIFLINRKNLFATDQQVLFLVHHDDASFKDKISEHMEQIRYFFNSVEERRVLESMYKIREEKMISNKIQADLGINIRIPYGFKIAELDAARKNSPDIKDLIKQARQSKWFLLIDENVYIEPGDDPLAWGANAAVDDSNGLRALIFGN